MSKPRILVQLDCDQHASVFDAVVAVDAGVDQLLQYARVAPGDVRDLVHGAMFTRGPQDLNHTAVFIGGSDVAAGETLLEMVSACFFGPMRVSVLMDSNGANTTAAAAVLAAARHVNWSETTVVVLAATGPVGQRVTRLLGRAGADVRVGSRSLERAAEVCDTVGKTIDGGTFTAVQTATADETAAALEDARVVIAAGASGVELLPQEVRQRSRSLKVAIDLNAVPPAGIAGIEVTDKGQDREGIICYGAIGVGGTKMKIHKAAIRKLFESNDQVFDAEEVLAIGHQLEANSRH